MLQKKSKEASEAMDRVELALLEKVLGSLRIEDPVQKKLKKYVNKCR